jgi:hypothetical protein
VHSDGQCVRFLFAYDTEPYVATSTSYRPPGRSRRWPQGAAQVPHEQDRAGPTPVLDPGKTGSLAPHRLNRGPFPPDHPCVRFGLEPSSNLGNERRGGGSRIAPTTGGHRIRFGSRPRVADSRGLTRIAFPRIPLKHKDLIPQSGMGRRRMSMDSDSFQAYFALDRNKSPEHKRLGWILFISHPMCRPLDRNESAAD